MITLESILSEETFVNLFIKDKDKRKQYAQEVFDLLQKSYSKIGGIKGSGFNSPEDMIDNIDMWKMRVRGGVVSAVRMYKGRAGRKGVASGHNGTRQGQLDYAKMTAEELSTGRAYSEVSQNIIDYIKKHVEPNPEKYYIPAETAAKLLGKKIEPIDKFWYNRDINGTIKQKIMIGNANAPRIDYNE